MRRVIAVLFSLVFGAQLCVAQQQILVPTRPVGDNSNAAASTAFVQGNTPGQITATPNQIPVFPGGGAAPVPTSATTWFDNAYCNTVGFLIVRLSGAWTCQQGIPVNINWFSGVDPTGATDSTTGIQNVINALPATGGRMYCTGNYKISSTLTMGNGSGAAGSTTQGFILEGVGNPTTPFSFTGGFTTTSGCKLTWNGGAADMLQIKGPLQGWGVKNVYFNCAGATAATTGLHVTSAQYGDSSNLTFNGCVHGYVSDTVAPFGSFTNTDSIHNKFYGTFVMVANATGATGITLTGTTTSNTDYNDFYDTAISFNGNCTSCVGLYQAAIDNVRFFGLQFAGAGGSNIQCVVYDYTVNNVWPASSAIYGIDTGNTAAGCATPYGVAGTPGAGAKSNFLFEVDETNGGAVPTGIVNLAVYGSHNIIMNAGGNVIGTDLMGAWSTFAPAPSCGTATFTTNAARSKTMGKTTWVSVDIVFTALGTCTTGVSPAFSFTLPNTSNLNTTLVGAEFVNSNGSIGCTITQGSSSVQKCIKNPAPSAITGTLVNWAGTDRILLSAVYENQ